MAVVHQLPPEQEALFALPDASTSESSGHELHIEERSDEFDKLWDMFNATEVRLMLGEVEIDDSGITTVEDVSS